MKVKKLIQNAKKEYVKDRLEQNQNNPRKFWRNDNDISFLGKSKHRQTLSKIMDKEGNIFENQEAADFLDEYYTTAGLAKRFSNTWNLESSDISVDTKFSFSPLSEFEVRKFVRDMKLSKSCALIGLSTRLVKDSFEVIIPELTYLLNKCINLGDFPES